MRRSEKVTATCDSSPLVVVVICGGQGWRRRDAATESSISIISANGALEKVVGQPLCSFF